MTKMRWMMRATVVGSVALLAGCGTLMGGSCKKAPAYANAEDHAPLKIPVGLDAPDTRAALKIPELNQPEVPRAANAPCLEVPPEATFAPAAAASPEAAAPEPEDDDSDGSRNRPFRSRPGM